MRFGEISYQLGRTWEWIRALMWFVVLFACGRNLWLALTARAEGDYNEAIYRLGMTILLYLVVKFNPLEE
jgi:hypothetical protein